MTVLLMSWVEDARLLDGVIDEDVESVSCPLVCWWARQDVGVTRRDDLVFLRVSLTKMGRLATPFPTGRAMARELAQVVPMCTNGVVVELGAGSGALTGPIRARLGPEARYVAIELDHVLAAHLRRHKPWLEVIEGDVTELDVLLDEAGIGRVDAFVSTLPWALFPHEVRARVIEMLARRLCPDGALSIIVTWMAPPGRVHALRELLSQSFDEVVETTTVWRNHPPARALLCRRPLPAGARGGRASA